MREGIDERRFPQQGAESGAATFSPVGGSQRARIFDVPRTGHFVAKCPAHFVWEMAHLRTTPYKSVPPQPVPDAASLAGRHSGQTPSEDICGREGKRKGPRRKVEPGGWSLEPLSRRKSLVLPGVCMTRGLLFGGFQPTISRPDRGLFVANSDTLPGVRALRTGGASVPLHFGRFCLLRRSGV
jgi:hypothetical protein